MFPGVLRGGIFNIIATDFIRNQLVRRGSLVATPPTNLINHLRSPSCFRKRTLEDEEKVYARNYKSRCLAFNDYELAQLRHCTRHDLDSSSRTRFEKKRECRGDPED